MSRHVVVVGAGVVGLFSALYARRAGFEVTVVERLARRRTGASYGNTGLIVPSHMVPLASPGAVWKALRWMGRPESPFALRPALDPELLMWGWRFWRASNRRRALRAGPLLRDLHRAAKDAYLELDGELTGDIGLRGTGLLMVCVTDEGLEEEAVHAARATAAGMPARLLQPSEAAALQPGLQLDVVGGVHYPEDAVLDPDRLMEALQARLVEQGVRFLWGHRVEGLEASDGHVRALRLAAGTAGGEAFETDRLALDELVLAAGVWSEDLARPVGLRLPMRAGKGYSLTLPSPPQRPSVPLILSEGRVAVASLPDGVRFGGTMEIGDVREGVSEHRVRGIVRSVVRALPGYRSEDFATTPVWYGFRPVSPDGLPYLGRSAVAANVIVATGHAMMGVSLAPVTGLLVRDLLEGRAPALPLDALDPDRYA